MSVHKKQEGTLGVLHSRDVDLVGDYAGQELFLVEGNSLLLDHFCDPLLDLDGGLQLLHLVYKVERFLQQLIDRRCRFDIVFFTSGSDFTIPSDVVQEAKPKFRFARTVVIHHLRHYLPRLQQPVIVRCFESHKATEFKQYLMRSGIHFIMCHDGAKAARCSSKGTSPGLETPDTHLRRYYHDMVVTFLRIGYGVALLNEIIFKDTKIVSKVFEGLKVPVAELDSEASVLEAPDDSELLSAVQPDDLATMHERLRNRQTKKWTSAVSQSTLLVCCTCQSMQRRGEPSTLISKIILHHVLLQSLSLRNRRLDISSEQTEILAQHDGSIVCALRCISAYLLAAEDYLSAFECDVADIWDGRLLASLCSNMANASLTSTAYEYYDVLCKCVGVEPISIPISFSISRRSFEPEPSVDSVLPFANTIFDSHLRSIRLEVNGQDASASSAAMRIFEELSHWHNSKRPISNKASRKASEWRERRRNQYLMAEMAAYAASLTNAVGKSLDPEVIIVNPAAMTGTSLPNRSNEMSKISGDKAGPKSSKVSKMTAQQLAKQTAFQKEERRQEKKLAETTAKWIASWGEKRRMIDAGLSGSVRYTTALRYLEELTDDKRQVLESEIRIHALSSLASEVCNGSSVNETSLHGECMNKLALIATGLQSFGGNKRFTKSEAAAVNAIAKMFNIPVKTTHNDDNTRKLSFEPDLPKSAIHVPTSWREFQLEHCGPYMDRSIDAADDDRVPFKPDAWQRRILDEIDENNSVLVIAPTSAGKTFISFYAMRKILSTSDDGVLVYLAPTKALVNQIAAEIQARFKKSYKHEGNSVWAVHTRDHRINNPYKCQILVTVPHILQIMLLNPDNAHAWAPRVKRIIFDEIHCIGQADDGLIWEQLLLLAHCPIIALSATVGNIDEFFEWVRVVQGAAGHKLIKVEHKYRYSDLRMHNYVPPKQFVFNGLPERSISSVQVSIDDPYMFPSIHPVASLVDRARGIPEDLRMEPRDCLGLFKVMKDVATESHMIDESTLGVNSLPSDITRKDVYEWEERLKNQLLCWMRDPEAPFDEVVQRLSQTQSGDSHRLEKYVSVHENVQLSQVSGFETDIIEDPNDLNNTTLPLLVSLEQQNMLPAILFNYDRASCESLCKGLLKRLEETEVIYKISNGSWQKKIKRFEKWQKMNDLATQKATAEKGKAKSRKNDDEEKASKLQREKADGSEDMSGFATFDPLAPLDAFSFADQRQLQSKELEEYLVKLRRWSVPEWLQEALKRGIGVHHAGMNRSYRQCVEVLFRKRFLRVVIATGTLALGINMPCKTTVFSGDSVFLTALNFRQAAGRAGRRGFDVLGNVVFQGLSIEKAHRLLSSRLPDLNGHFPITTTLVLRLCALLHNSKSSPYAQKAVNALLSQPRIYLGASTFKDQVLHHLRFSIEYLRRQHLLSVDGAPLNFAGTITHLYYTENSGFAFHVLLKNGYFHELAERHRDLPGSSRDTIMLVLSHIFCRRVCSVTESEYRTRNLKYSSSKIFLPALPETARQLLSDHNADILRIYKTYVRTFAEQHLSDVDECLPVSRLAFNRSTENGVITHLVAPLVRSSFVALSDHDDSFESIDDLCDTVRSGVFLEKSVIPQLDVYPDPVGRKLNAYLFDFFNHEDIHAIERDNGIRKSDIWFLLNEFSLILATIVTNLTNYMKFKTTDGLDMLSIQNASERADEALEDTSAAAEKMTGDKPQRPQQVSGTSSIRLGHRVKAKRKTVTDSWDADASEEETADEQEIPKPNEIADQSSTGLLAVLAMFVDLQMEFDAKFRRMWA